VGDTNLTALARDWFDNVLYELEATGYWKFLEKEAGYTTASATGTKYIAFSASAFDITKSTGATPWATFTSPIADYSKGLSIWNFTDTTALIQVSKEALDELDDGSAGVPKFFAIWNDEIHFFPESNAAKILTLKYFAELSIPTADSDDLETTCNIKPKYQRFLINGLVAEAMTYLDDNRQGFFRNLWEKNILWMMRDNDESFNIRENLQDKTSLYRTSRQPIMGGNPDTGNQGR
jgi:hypothetical protein